MLMQVVGQLLWKSECDAVGNIVYGYYDTTTGELCENQDDLEGSCRLTYMANARSYNCN